jgi:hypothetical protein
LPNSAEHDFNLLFSKIGPPMILELADIRIKPGQQAAFEEAIARGATSIRVGSTIFGERIYPKA